MRKFVLRTSSIVFFPFQILGWISFMVFSSTRYGWWKAELYFTRLVGDK